MSETTLTRPAWHREIRAGAGPADAVATVVSDHLSALPPGQQILELGCGCGELAERLVRAGQIVTIVDHRRPLLEVARRRIGFAVDARLCELGGSFDFARHGDFDVVVATQPADEPLRWPAPASEIDRVVCRGGRLLVVLVHPLSSRDDAPAVDRARAALLDRGYAIPRSPRYRAAAHVTLIDAHRRT